ncbi:hypothetical protein H257_02869 [Aphanomyces astaci]|uniref:Uncharacterized protein n=1 Tax=Aphanomyces astaci TaxID=112090 RepID=W4H075_APHAT|nr:hypothetical protein H257_02869 [Aphanomyces astaci]ETV84976.1 hypothetical protein H257_02869 [Aphanomyces astaci]|eukprot:XP_009824994.1 hypothetical protein H257_02869 [Aphanomyces astaci]
MSRTVSMGISHADDVAEDEGDGAGRRLGVRSSSTSSLSPPPAVVVSYPVAFESPRLSHPRGPNNRFDNVKYVSDPHSANVAVSPLDDWSESPPMTTSRNARVNAASRSSRGIASRWSTDVNSNAAVSRRDMTVRAQLHRRFDGLSRIELVMTWRNAGMEAGADGSPRNQNCHSSRHDTNGYNHVVLVVVLAIGVIAVGVLVRRKLVDADDVVGAAGGVGGWIDHLEALAGMVDAS